MEHTLYEMLNEIRKVGNPEIKGNLERIWNGLYEEYAEMVADHPEVVVEDEVDDTDDESYDRIVWSDNTDDDDDDDDDEED